MTARRLWLAVALAAGCSDTFLLPLGHPTLDSAGTADLAPSALDGDAADLAPPDLASGALPAACAQLACTPAAVEGDVTISSGEVSGCHAYRSLQIASVVTVTDGMVFAACADTILIGGALSADGRGAHAGQGPGAGGACGGGGGHGGKGGDPGGCGGGATYGDPMIPRTLGSGGGGFAGDGGNGGGAIELAAATFNLIGLVTANGATGSGAVAGGGSGGSVLIHAEQLNGAGQVIARGGNGFGIAGGGGGGGRVAVLAVTSVAGVTIDVRGGRSTTTGPDGADGTTLQTP